MKHPEAFLVPILMFLDYFLTVLGAVQKAKKHGEHFKTQHYELNPIWQKAIAQKKWFNPRHAFSTVFVSAYVIWLTNDIDTSDELSEGILGFLIVTFAVVVGRHASNLLIFRYSIQNPEGISGQVRMSHPTVLAMSSYPYLTVLLPTILIAVCSGSTFAYGGVAGICLLLFWHFIWWSKAKKKVARQEASITGTE
jgi:hypothetical protein